jgi:fructose-1,6-bisphosphatase/inositol monophosphatase family enzyme
MSRNRESYSLPKGFVPIARLMIRVADEIIMPSCKRRDLVRGTKTDGTDVTSIDKRAEDALLDQLKKWHPQAALLSEETATAQTNWEKYRGIGRKNGRYVPGHKDRLILIDPVCGTANLPKGPIGMMIGIFEKGKALGVWSYNPCKRAFLFASEELTTHWIKVESDIEFARPERVRMPLQSIEKTSLHYFILSQHKNPENHKAAALTLFQSVANAFKDFQPTFSAAASTYAMLVTGTVGAAVYPEYVTPWDLFNLAFLVEKAGGTTLTMEGEHYRSCCAKGVVTALTHPIANNLASAYRNANQGSGKALS